MLFCSGCETSYATGARFCARCGRQLAELPELLRNLEEQVARFKAWADAYPRPLAERSGYWECDYEDWNAVYDAVIPFVAATTCEQWSVPTTRLVLYILARDNAFGQVGSELRKKPDTLVCVAQRALELADTEADAKWQLAVELSRVGWLSQQVEALLLAFAQDPDEYVRRRALVALADLGAPLAAGFIESALCSRTPSPAMPPCLLLNGDRVADTHTRPRTNRGLRWIFPWGDRSSSGSYRSSPYAHKLEPTGTISIGGRRPDLVCLVDDHGSEAIAGFEVKADADHEKGLIQASCYRDGVHEVPDKRSRN